MISEDIKQLALGLEGVTQEQLRWISRLIQKHTKQILNIKNTTVFVETGSNVKTVLKRLNLGEVSSENVENLKDNNNNYRGQAFMAFDSATPLWIVSKNGQRKLQSADEYLDLWSNKKRIPKFRPKTKNPQNNNDATKTSISIPLKKRKDGRVFGVINFRSDDYIEPSDESKKELGFLVKATSYLYSLYETRSISNRQTNEAIGIVEQRITENDKKLIPKVFVASPKRADKEVVASINSVLENYKNKVDFFHWDRMEDPGNIITNLLKVIKESKYGICYFSEKNEEGVYVDNANVIFEAGMFQGRRNIDKSSAWIPIREKEPPDMFFDIAQENILLIDRNKNGALKTNIFRKALEKRITAMIDTQKKDDLGIGGR